MSYEVLYAGRTRKLEPGVTSIRGEPDFENKKGTAGTLRLNEFNQFIQEVIGSLELKGKSIIMLLRSYDLLLKGFQYGGLPLL